MNSAAPSSSLGDPFRRRAILASVLLHGLVLSGMVVYLLQPKLSSPPIASEMVFEFGGVTKMPKAEKPLEVSPAQKLPRDAKPVLKKAKPVPTKPEVKPAKPIARVSRPEPRVAVRAVPRPQVNSQKPTQAAQPRVALPKPQAIKLNRGAPLPTLKPSVKPSESKPTVTSSDKPMKTPTAQPEPVRLATVTAPTSGPEAEPATQAAATTSGAELETERPTAPASSTGATQETAALPKAPSSATATRDTGVAGSKQNTPQATADSGLAGTTPRKPSTPTRETGPAGSGSSQTTDSSREIGPASVGAKTPSAGSTRENGPANAKPFTSGSSQESGPATSAPKPTGPSSPEARGPATRPVGSSTPESKGSKTSGSSAEGTGLFESSGTSAEGKVQRCAIVIDVRRITPPLRANMSPAILDPNGRKVWPDANAVQDVDSELVNETGIASFVSSPQAALSLLVTGVNPLELRAVGTAIAEGVKDTSVRDYVVVSAADADRISRLKNCQIVFVK